MARILVPVNNCRQHCTNCDIYIYRVRGIERKEKSGRNKEKGKSKKGREKKFEIFADK